jgi:hypothetical protein
LLIEPTIDIVLLLHPLELSFQSLNQLKLPLVLLLEINKHLLAVDLCGYHIVLDVTLKLLILCLEGEELCVLGLQR